MSQDCVMRFFGDSLAMTFTLFLMGGGNEKKKKIGSEGFQLGGSGYQKQTLFFRPHRDYHLPIWICGHQGHTQPILMKEGHNQIMGRNVFF